MSGISSILSSGWKYAKRAGKLYPDFVFGTGNEAFSNALQKTVKNRGSQGYFSAVWDGIKKGAVEAEKHNASLVKKHGGFWQSTWKALKTTPAKIQQGWRIGGKLADKAGKTGLSKLWAQFKGSLSGLGKRMPLIGSLIVLATELPNIFSAFKDEGFIGGVKEIGKSGLRLGSGMLGAAIGQALIPIPIVGSIVGYVAGDWLMSKITGKSHSEKKAEAEEALAQANTAEQQNQQLQQYLAQQQMNPYGNNTFASNPYAQNSFNMPQATMTPQQLMQMQQMLYSGGMNSAMDQDFMAMTSGIKNLNYYC